ncbi:MAG: ATP-binding protein [Gemmatimonadales bacterium]|nr:ATP-binding protein [Gemmatimonadales bacterium]
MTTPSIPPDFPPGRTGEFPVPAPPVRALDRLRIPGPRALIGGIILVRLVLIGLVFGSAMTPTVGDFLPASLRVVAGVLGLVAIGWLAMVSRRVPGPISPTTLFVQSTVDILLVTSLVSGDATPLAALYVALVVVYGLLLPTGRALLTTIFAGACYVWVTRGSPDAGLAWSQATVIALVGGLVAVLGNRLTFASREQTVLAEALVQAKLEAEEILSSIQSGVIMVDGQGRLGYLNPRGAKILGDSDFVPGQPVLDALRSRSRELHEAIVRGITEGVRISRGEATVRRNDGTLFPVGLSTTTFRRPGSERALVTAIFTDISDLKRLQEFRVRAERLEAVAELSASLAHEIRNPLAAIRSAVEQLARSVGRDEDDQVLATLVMRESERLNRLLSEFLDFSRVRASRFERLELLGLVEGVARITREHPETRGTTFTVVGEPVELEGDEDLLHRVASNLMLNAAQALAGQGEVTITVRRARPGEAPVGRVDRPVMLLVQDNGPGIPESVRSRLFEPFVSGRSGGSGLGLAIVQRAVEAHRGVILVDTVAGKGTTFSIFLPATWAREETA